MRYDSAVQRSKCNPTPAPCSPSTASPLGPANDIVHNVVLLTSASRAANDVRRLRLRRHHVSEIVNKQLPREGLSPQSYSLASQHLLARHARLIGWPLRSSACQRRCIPAPRQGQRSARESNFSATPRRLRGRCSLVHDRCRNAPRSPSRPTLLRCKPSGSAVVQNSFIPEPGRL